MDVPTKLFAVRVDERLEQRLRQELKLVRDEEAEPVRLSALVRRLLREALDHRQQPRPVAK
jgi:hypothetical protein